MTKEEFQQVFTNTKSKFPYNGEFKYLKWYIMMIMRDELEKFYLNNYPENWIPTTPLPTLKKLWDFVISKNKHDFIHRFKSKGVINTGWDYTECFKLINPNISKTYQKYYGNIDPPKRSLINFLESHEQALWEIIDYFQKHGYNIDFCNYKTRVQELDNFRRLINKYSREIFYQYGDLFPEMIKEIIITKSNGKEAVNTVQSDLKKKGFQYITTDSGDLLDIEKGIDLIFVNPSELSKKTMQIKTSNDIRWGKENENIIVYCANTSIKSYNKNWVNYISFVNDGKSFYFFNENVKKKDDNDGYVFKPDSYTEDLIHPSKKPVLTF